MQLHIHAGIKVKPYYWKKDHWNIQELKASYISMQHYLTHSQDGNIMQTIIIYTIYYALMDS